MAHSTVEAGVHSYDLKPQKPKLKMQMPARVVDEVGPGTAMMTPITQTLHMSQQMSSSASSSTVKCLDVCVFLRDGSGHEFSVECGKRATAQDLCDLMQANLCLPPVASELFCLWLSSPLLKLQLKPHHVPFKLYRQWPDLLDRFTSATEDQKSRDEPVLIYQRNAFFPKSREKRITDNKILLRLFDEAKDNLLDGYYPCSSEDYDRLAAILARIDHGPFLSRRHTPAFFKNKLSSYYPAHLCKTSWSLPVSSKNTAEYRIVEQYKSLQDNCNNNQYRQMLLDFCWSLPYYGCVFFTGQIEKPCHGSRKVRENPDRLIYIAINRDGVFIIDISKCVSISKKSVFKIIDIIKPMVLNDS
uniref:FERM domain-containing protein 8 n=1 Tax=Saccoglossus kowalevskii TaxID=10224 RepID=A0ABM0LZH4_SACKO|nr:PREDICTED: FERM domain-containing protein 8-like [Saccoglossus kowalevskii]